jgi:hypothetical protein
VSDELEDYLRDAMKDPGFRAAYERQARSNPWRMAGGAAAGALACLGASTLRLAEGLRDFWRGARGVRGRRVAAAAVLVAAWIWVAVMIVA